MNIEPNASIFNTDGLSFPCFDDNVCALPDSSSRKAKDVIFRSDFPGSKKMTIVNPNKGKPKQMSWDDIYENNRVSKIGHAIKNEFTASFADDLFNDEANRQRQPNISKQRITLAADLTKARTIDKSRLPRKTKSLNKKSGEEHNVKDRQTYTQAEPIVVNWCRTVKPVITNRLADASQISEVTSTTSATSLSGEYNEVFQKRKIDTSNRCASRSKTVGGTPSRRINTDMLNVHKSTPKETYFRSDFEVNWPSTHGEVASREQINLRQIRDTPVKTSQRNPTPKRAVSASKNLRRTSIGVGYLADTSPTEARPVSTNRRGSLDNRQHATLGKNKPRIYMSVSSPRKAVNMKSVYARPNNAKYSSNHIPRNDANIRAFECKRTDKTGATNAEPLDFSEFDTEDFSTSDDMNEGFSMPFKPVEPIYCTSNQNKAFFPSIDDDAEEEAWSALFSPPFH